jgi:hypothetical protein
MERFVRAAGQCTGLSAACFCSLLLLSACSGPVAENGSSPAELAGFTACVEPRPQVCTQQYDPVCGRLANGDTVTYANSCMACSDADVSGYLPGACP